MNFFRLIADMLHLCAILTLLYRIKVTRNCIGKYNSHENRIIVTSVTLSNDNLLGEVHLWVRFLPNVSFWRGN